MNGHLEPQTSGNEWTPQIPQMLHERIQVPLVLRADYQGSILTEFEAEKARIESQYAALLMRLYKLYVPAEDGSVGDFLDKHRALPNILIAAKPQLRRLFGDTAFVLRVESDEFGWQNLYVDALWPSEAADAYHLLDKFIDDWWLAQSRSARGALTFTFRLV